MKLRGEKKKINLQFKLEQKFKLCTCLLRTTNSMLFQHKQCKFRRLIKFSFSIIKLLSASELCFVILNKILAFAKCAEFFFFFVCLLVSWQISTNNLLAERYVRKFFIILFVFLLFVTTRFIRHSSYCLGCPQDFADWHAFIILSVSWNDKFLQYYCLSSTYYRRTSTKIFVFL